MPGTLFINAQIYTPIDKGFALGGENQSKLTHYPKGALWQENGIIKQVGEQKELMTRITGDVEVIDCHGLCVIPGLVDPHTHMCFTETREREFLFRLQGLEYLEILKRGGGILASVKSIAQASPQELYTKTKENVAIALAHGTTCLEIKSGYGLDTFNELKMLKAIEQVRQKTPLDIACTFLGAHAIPQAYKDNPQAYVDLITEEMIPQVAKQGIAEFCDVFCEQGVFDIKQSRKILKTGLKYGLKPKIHADEVHDLGGSLLAAELKAVTADHLLAANDQNLKAMQKQGVIAVILPGTAYSLKKPYAKAKKMISYGLPCALATDCNPGSSYVFSMPFVMGLAIMQMGLSPEEALVAATLNAAYALDREKILGSLEKGKQADFCVLKGETPACIAYRAGVNPIFRVYKKGRLVAEN